MTTRFKPNWCTHPGDHISEYIEISELSQAAFARKARITPKLLSTIITKKARVSARTALKLEKVTNLSAETWMALQSQWDLSQARSKP